jgi:hypothetical protein
MARMLEEPGTAGRTFELGSSEIVESSGCGRARSIASCPNSPERIVVSEASRLAPI